MQPGDTIVRRFQIEREVGVGGMGTVFAARDLETGAKVAVKRLDIRSRNDSERFAREASVLAELDHPGIVRYVAHGKTEQGEDFIAMEWLEGQTLGDRLVDGPLSLIETVQLGTRIASALGEAHRRGVVHRDIKPPNLFLPDDDIVRVKLLDFGVARLTGSGTHATMTRTGALIGTPGYMAPEQARGEKELDARADLFSVGSVLFQCLTGKPPFSGTNIMAVLAKILLEEAPRVRELRPDAPMALDDLVARLLAKEPNERPQTIQEVGAALSAISIGELQSSSAYFETEREREAPTKPPSLGDSELRVLCVVLSGDPAGTDDTWSPAEVSTADHDINTIVRDLGGQIDPMIDGTTLIHFAGSGAATDLATDAARCALTIRRLYPDTPVVLATGRGELSRRMPVGEVIDRAARTLEAAPTKNVRIDAVSAGLLELKFEVAADAGGWFLAREKESVTGARTLLGKPTKLVGRDRELVTLEATFTEVTEEPVARAVLITGGAGMGKSRLVHEFLKRTRARESSSALILGARGDAHRGSLAFGMLAAALRREAAIAEGEAIESQRDKLAALVARHVAPAEQLRTTVFLGEVVNLAFGDDQFEGLRAARADAMLMGDAMRTAWLDWLGAELSDHPILVLFDEMHWCDLPTVRFLDAALKRFADAPLMVLALARPSVKDRFPKLWAGAEPMELNLGALTKRATEKLIKQVLEDAPPKTVELIIERGEGNPFIIEELMRAVAAGREGELPDSVLGMVQARLDDLGAAGKRVLRAASVFGNTFWRGGVLALLGGSESTISVSELLDELVHREIIVRSTRTAFPGEIEFHFGNTSVRDAAYAMLTDRDRKLGHRLAGQWLESSGQRDAIVLAGHFDRGSENERAIGFYVRAAEQALEGNDFAAAIHCAERGVVLGAEMEVLGRLELSRAIAHYWLGEVGKTAVAAEQASLHLPQGAAGWYRAVGEVLSSLLRSGDVDRLEEWIDRAATAPPAKDAVDAQVICLARTAEHLLLLGHYELSEKLFTRVDAAAERTELEPLALARVYRARARRALHHGDPGTYADGLAAAYQTFEQGGDARNACNERMNMGFALAELGEFHQAKEALENARNAAERMNLEHVIAWADNNLGNVLALSDLDSAKRVEQRAIDAGVEQKDPRLEGTSRIYMSGILHRMGNGPSALSEAERAVELLANLIPLKTVALAAEARALLAVKRNDDALRTAGEAMQHLETLGGLEEGEALVRLVYAEALDAADREEEAKAAIQIARDRLYLRAGRISNVAWRVSFLERVPDHARTIELASDLGLDDSATLRD